MQTDPASPPFPTERHAELREELHYEAPAAPTPDQPSSGWKWDFDFDWLTDMSPLFTLLVLILVLIPLGVIIYKLLGAVAARCRARRGGGAAGEVRLDEIEEEEMVLGGVKRSLLQRAEDAGQYDVAVRLLYIRLLKDLNDRELIRYRKDLSNRDYRRQLAGQSVAADFREVTDDYERYWYGKYRIDRLSYRLVREKFDHLSEQLQPETDE